MEIFWDVEAGKDVDVSPNVIAQSDVLYLFTGKYSLPFVSYTSISIDPSIPPSTKYTSGILNNTFLS